MSKALLFFKLDLASGEKRLKEMMSYLENSGRIKAVSTIYKRYIGRVSSDLAANIELAVYHDTELSLEDYLRHINNIASLSRGPKERLEIYLLCFEQVVSMTPSLTLPSPLFLSDSLVRKCSAEVWADYEHPIMKKALSALAAEVSLEENTEFYKQGNTQNIL